MLEIGSVVDGKYKILNKIGQGGMSIVYLAMNEKANKQWAIKEVRKDGVQDFEVVKQGLIAETDMLKKLSHPNLPSIVDVIDGEGTFLIVMDYIEGNSLSKALEEHGPQPQEYVIEWARQLCDVLGYLHTREPAIIYRDMKPANIMLKPNGQVCLIDFGTAREFKNRNIQDTICLGTKGYAAPEQYGGQGETDARTDIYCLGATMYHLLTGHNPALPPYEMKPIRHWNPTLSAGLEAIILKCTRQDRDERYQSCAELLYALENYEEPDITFKRKQKIRMGLFAGAVMLSMTSAAVCGVSRSKEVQIQTRNYDNLVTKASGEEGEEAIDYYRQAIEINNTRLEAYDGLLDKLIAENDHSKVEFLDKQEKNIIEDILNQSNGNTTNYESFKDENPLECAAFLEKYVNVLMYESGTEDTEAMIRASDDTKASMYLQEIIKIIESEEISAEKYASVYTYAEFLEYKEQAGVQGINAGLNYADYFKALKKMCENGAFHTNYYQTASFYWDILDIFNTNEVLSGFRKADVKDEEILELLGKIQEDIEKEGFKETIENSLFWHNSFITEGESQNLEEYVQSVYKRISSGTDAS